MSEDVLGDGWRWNWENAVDGLEICTGRHRKHDPCDYRPATEEEKRSHEEIEEYKRGSTLKEKTDNAKRTNQGRTW